MERNFTVWVRDVGMSMFADQAIGCTWEEAIDEGRQCLKQWPTTTVFITRENGVGMGEPVVCSLKSGELFNLITKKVI